MQGSATYTTRDRLGGQTNIGPTLTVALGGTLLKLKAPPGAIEQIGGAKRGSIVSYSRASRRRLMEFFNSLDRSKVENTPLFLTLTYPEVFPSNIQQSKAHLFAFCKRIIRRHKDAAIVWRLEWQKRGAPHYHLLAFNVPFLPHQDVAAWWYDCSDSADTRQLAAGTRVERIREWNGVVFYASKYLGKLGDVPAGCQPGRLWGVVNRKCLPRTLLVQTLDWQSYWRVRRVVWRRADKLALATGRKSRLVGMTVFVPTAVAMKLYQQAAGHGNPHR